MVSTSASSAAGLDDAPGAASASCSSVSDADLELELELRSMVDHIVDENKRHGPGACVLTVVAALHLSMWLTARKVG